MCHIVDLPTHLQAQVVGAIGEEDHHISAYIYEFSDDSYFHYLHDARLSSEQFQKAREAILHDLFLLARHGIVYTALADLFHNLEQIDDRADQGQYLPLIDLIRRSARMGSGA